jgi:hypothetical protein
VPGKRFTAQLKDFLLELSGLPVAGAGRRL